MARHRAARTRKIRTLMAGGVALATVPAVAAVAATQPESVAGVRLAALVIGASSTNPGGDGVADFYGGRFQQDPTVVANFFTGPAGIYRAIQANQGDDDTVVLASGWGAANASALLSYHKLTGDPVVTSPQLYLLDNNVARPNGGFGTRYPIFALIGVNPVPTPTDPGVDVIDVGYEYDINGNTPAYVLNPVSMANSLATYFDNRLNQTSVDLPVTDDGELDLSDSECDAACQTDIADGKETTVHLDTGETVVIKKVDSTTYISYRTEGLPLLQPLRTYGGDVGNTIADASEPALKAAVDYGYPDNDALANPDKYVPARLVPTRKETETFVRDFTAGVQQGARPLVRTSLDFSPKTRTSERSRGSKRPVAGLVKSVAERVDALAKKLSDGVTGGI
ncbi:hypothetical protein MMAG44476_37173 [Mycolicibacterium mageritense DSM 44476 = CIP 104973]|nr:PE-PPE domain-containing protein [Mycolicibacterium mageritense]CDO23870.1 PE-PPE domain-containing protein [Mycolicibacterium mageritense DSM 44476 = CIP 104973]